MALSSQATARRLKFSLFFRAASVTPGHPNYSYSVELHERLSRSTAHRKKLKESGDRAIALLFAYHLNGPGLFADVYLRRLYEEYSNRLFHGFGAEQPTSFSVMNAFIEPDDHAFAFKLLDERFYQCDLSDYLDFITGEVSLPKTVDPNSFEELKVYELNCIGTFSQIVLPGFGDFVFCGAAMVREESELAILGIFGNKSASYDPKGFTDIDGESILPSKRELFRRVGKEGTLDSAPELLFDNADYYPVLALTRIDLNKMVIQVQHLMFEAKDFFRVVTDDPSIYYDSSGNLIDDPKIPKIKENATKELAKYSHVFDFMYYLVHFPRFAALNEDDFHIERHPTQIKLQASPKIKNIKRVIGRIKSKLEPQYWPSYREVLTLNPRTVTRVPRSLEAMELRRETSGFWKMLPLEKVGTDKHGNEVQGKTWVTKELSWTEKGLEAEQPVSSISIVPRPLEQEIGYIYIMRSPVHERHVYKIGFTNRNPEERAGDLSASSGQPDHLVVLQSWKVQDARRVEQVIHRELAQFRLSGKREFFRVKFEHLRSVIEEVISRMKAFVSGAFDGAAGQD
jgi:hypothetical protein